MVNISDSWIVYAYGVLRGYVQRNERITTYKENVQFGYPSQTFAGITMTSDDCEPLIRGPT